LQTKSSDIFTQESERNLHELQPSGKQNVNMNNKKAEFFGHAVLSFFFDTV
jgi:hypothetical protein